MTVYVCVCVRVCLCIRVCLYVCKCAPTPCKYRFAYGPTAVGPCVYLLGLGLQGVVQDSGLLQLLVQFGHLLLLLLLQALPLLLELGYVLLCAPANTYTDTHTRTPMRPKEVGFN